MTARPRPDVRVACPLCRSRIVAESGERGIVLAEHPIPGGATCAGSGFALPPASHPGWGRLAQALIAQEASLATPRGEA